MTKFKLLHNRPDCIGCGACAAITPEFWVMNADGKADIISGKEMENQWQELEIEDKDFASNKDAADSCPVNVIHIKNLDTDEDII